MPSDGHSVAGGGGRECLRCSSGTVSLSGRPTDSLYNRFGGGDDVGNSSPGGKRPLLLLLLAMKICFVEQTANLVICSPTNGGRSSFCSDVLFLIFSDRLLKEKSCCRCCCFASDWPLMSALLCCVEVMITNSHY